MNPGRFNLVYAVSASIERLGRREASAAVDAVGRSLHTQNDLSLPDVGRDYGGLFDELYDALRDFHWRWLCTLSKLYFIDTRDH